MNNMVNILVFLWIVFILLLLSMVARKVINHSVTFPFQDYDKTDIPYIKLDIQGFSFNFLIDTGCGVSIIIKDALSQIEYTESPRKIQLQALTSDSLNAGMVTIPINANGKQVNEDFVVYDNSDIANFQTHYGIAIHGILGNEFLDKTGCQIDYKNHIVLLP